jgi:hypothetical protein
VHMWLVSLISVSAALLDILEANLRAAYMSYLCIE